MRDEYKLRVKVKKAYAKGAAWMSILKDDTVQLELCEWDSEIYGDHSNFYDVQPVNKTLLVDALSKHIGLKIGNDEVLIAAFVSAFEDAQDILNWLRQVDIPLNEHWAYV